MRSRLRIVCARAACGSRELVALARCGHDIQALSNRLPELEWRCHCAVVNAMVLSGQVLVDIELDAISTNDTVGLAGMLRRRLAVGFERFQSVGVGVSIESWCASSALGGVLRTDYVDHLAEPSLALAENSSTWCSLVVDAACPGGGYWVSALWRASSGTRSRRRRRHLNFQGASCCCASPDQSLGAEALVVHARRVGRWAPWRMQRPFSHCKRGVGLELPAVDGAAVIQQPASGTRPKGKRTCLVGRGVEW